MATITETQVQRAEMERSARRIATVFAHFTKPGRDAAATYTVEVGGREFTVQVATKGYRPPRGEADAR